jgi:hypothetical protein
MEGIFFLFEGINIFGFEEMEFGGILDFWC